jgi:hypothetical protein
MTYHSTVPLPGNPDMSQIVGDYQYHLSLTPLRCKRYIRPKRW